MYLVAPTLRFHPSFATLAQTIAPDIEIYRFDVNEDWRTSVRVVRREMLSFLLRVVLNPLLFTFIFGFVMPRMGIIDRKSTRLNSSHSGESRMPSSA